MRKFQVLLVFAFMSLTCGFSQKIKTTYDKSVDFSRYKSYSWKEPEINPGRPLLYFTVVGAIKGGLETSGLTRMEKDGDLTVVAHGDLDYGLNNTGVTTDSCKNCQSPAVDPRDLGRTVAPNGSAGMPLPKGALELELVDRATNKVVWSGTVVQKLNPDKKQQALERADAAIRKLLAEFPPKK